MLLQFVEVFTFCHDYISMRGKGERGREGRREEGGREGGRERERERERERDEVRGRSLHTPLKHVHTDEAS